MFSQNGEHKKEVESSLSNDNIFKRSVPANSEHNPMRRIE